MPLESTHSDLGISWEDATGADLLVYIALRDEDEKIGEAACEEFYRRHAPYLHAKLNRFSSALGGDQDVDDLFSLTLQKAFAKAHTFSSDGIDDEAIVERKVRAWLFRIAHNTFISIKRKQAPPAVDLEHARASRELKAEPDKTAVPSMNRRTLDMCLDSLPQKQKDALLLSYQYYDLRKENNRLSKTESRNIADILGTTTTNLRQLRSRGERALRECVEKHQAMRED